jgi:hypothetical protein
VRVDGGTKTELSRRTLEIQTRQPTRYDSTAPGKTSIGLSRARRGRTHDLVSRTRTGTELEAGNVRRALRAITKAANIGEDWTPPTA